MSKNVFFVSDTHFGHEKTCTVFKRSDGSALRPFKDAEEMNEAMVERWNAKVQPHDKVYHLGDVVINKKFMHILGRLNGDKVLIKGNHDHFELKEYLPYFRDIRGYHVLNGMILSHIPVHTASLARFGTNIHGHLHSERMMVEVNGQMVIDPRYHSVCVEQTDYCPISFEEVQARIVKEGGTVGFKNGNGPQEAM